ncbi:MAG: hypothetical protein LC749_19845 [Actinobacteria bacterium]|nr:hypothetical protein [Actinomycetota bacterium]
MAASVTAPTVDAPSPAAPISRVMVSGPARSPADYLRRTTCDGFRMTMADARDPVRTETVRPPGSPEHQRVDVILCPSRSGDTCQDAGRHSAQSQLDDAYRVVPGHNKVEATESP